MRYLDNIEFLCWCCYHPSLRLDRICIRRQNWKYTFRRCKCNIRILRANSRGNLRRKLGIPQKLHRNNILCDFSINININHIYNNTEMYLHSYIASNNSKYISKLVDNDRPHFISTQILYYTTLRLLVFLLRGSKRRIIFELR